MALYVYAITREAVIPAAEGVDRTQTFGTVAVDGIAAVYTRVDDDAFSQEAIDSRAGDLEWLGAIGYRHQGVVAELMKMTAIVPLRAFTLFSGEEALEKYLVANQSALDEALNRLDGKQEWTLRIEFEPQAWSDSLVRRVDTLQQLDREAQSAAAGKAFLIRKKIEDEKKRASREAEEQLVAEIAGEVGKRLSGRTVAETRQQREGAFPQIDVLINRDEEAVLQELGADLNKRYAADGVTLAITGPWPPYTFAALQ